MLTWWALTEERNPIHMGKSLPYWKNIAPSYAKSHCDCQKPLVHFIRFRTPWIGIREPPVRPRIHDLIIVQYDPLIRLVKLIQQSHTYCWLGILNPWPSTRERSAHVARAMLQYAYWYQSTLHVRYLKKSCAHLQQNSSNLDDVHVKKRKLKAGSNIWT